MALYLQLCAGIVFHNFDSETESTSHPSLMKTREFFDLRCMCAVLLFDGNELPCYDWAFIVSVIWHGLNEMAKGLLKLEYQYRSTLAKYWFSLTSYSAGTESQDSSWWISFSFDSVYVDNILMFAEQSEICISCGLMKNRCGGNVVQLWCY